MIAQNACMALSGVQLYYFLGVYLVLMCAGYSHINILKYQKMRFSISFLTCTENLQSKLGCVGKIFSKFYKQQRQD